MNAPVFTPLPMPPAPPDRETVLSWSANEQLACLRGYYEALLAHTQSLLSLAVHTPHGELDRRLLADAAYQTASGLQRAIAPDALEAMLALLPLSAPIQSQIDHALELLRGSAPQIELFLDPRILEALLDEQSIARLPNCTAHLANRVGPSLRLGGLEAAHILASARLLGWNGAAGMVFESLPDGRIRMVLGERQQIREAEALELAQAVHRIIAGIQTPEHPFAKSHLHLARFAARGAFTLYLC